MAANIYIPPTAPTLQEELMAEDFERLSKKKFPTFDALFEEARELAKRYGHGIATKGSNNPKPFPGGPLPGRHELICVKGKGNKIVDNSVRKKTHKITRDDCPWTAAAVHYGDASDPTHHGWTLVTIKKKTWAETVHNHAAHDKPETIASHRNATRKNLKETIIEMSKVTTKVSAMDIASNINKLPDGSGKGIAKSDVLAILKESKLKASNGLSDDQQFLLAIRDDKRFISKTEENPKTGEIDRIAFTNEDCLDLVRANPEVYVYDDTECTNDHGLSLVQVNGVACNNQTFSIMWGLISGKKSERHEWVLNVLKEMTDDRGIDRPKVALTDMCVPIKEAFTAVYGEETKQMICLWHVMKNIVHHVKLKWKGGLSGTAVGEAGNGKGKRTVMSDEEADEEVASRLLERLDNIRVNGKNKVARKIIGKMIDGFEPLDKARTSKRKYKDNADGFLCCAADMIHCNGDESSFQAGWALLNKEFAAQDDMLSYLQRIWLPLAHQFARYATQWYRHLGNTTTGRTEGQHRLIKSLLRNRRAKLTELLDAIEEAWFRQQLRYTADIAAQKFTSQGRYKVGIFKDIHPYVTEAALGLIYKEVEAAEEMFKEDGPLIVPDIPDDPENDPAWQSLGLPGFGRIYELLHLNRAATEKSDAWEKGKKVPITVAKLSLMEIHSHWWLPGSIDNPDAKIQTQSVERKYVKKKHQTNSKRSTAWANRAQSDHPAENGVTHTGRINSHDEPLRGKKRPRGVATSLAPSSLAAPRSTAPARLAAGDDEPMQDCITVVDDDEEDSDNPFADSEDEDDEPARLEPRTELRLKSHGNKRRRLIQNDITLNTTRESQVLKQAMDAYRSEDNAPPRASGRVRKATKGFEKAMRAEMEDSQGRPL